MDRQVSTVFKKNIYLLKPENVTRRDNEVFLPHLTTDMDRLRRTNQFKTGVEFDINMSEDVIRRRLEKTFPELINKRYSCAARAAQSGTMLTFHGKRRVWDGATIKKKLRGASALYIVVEDEALQVPGLATVPSGARGLTGAADSGNHHPVDRNPVDTISLTAAVTPNSKGVYPGFLDICTFQTSQLPGPATVTSRRSTGAADSENYHPVDRNPVDTVTLTDAVTPNSKDVYPGIFDICTFQTSQVPGPATATSDRSTGAAASESHHYQFIPVDTDTLTDAAPPDLKDVNAGLFLDLKSLLDEFLENGQNAEQMDSRGSETTFPFDVIQEHNKSYQLPSATAEGIERSEIGYSSAGSSSQDQELGQENAATTDDNRSSLESYQLPSATAEGIERPETGYSSAESSSQDQELGQENAATTDDNRSSLEVFAQAARTREICQAGYSSEEANSSKDQGLDKEAAVVIVPNSGSVDGGTPFSLDNLQVEGAVTYLLVSFGAKQVGATREYGGNSWLGKSPPGEPGSVIVTVTAGETKANLGDTIFTYELEMEKNKQSVSKKRELSRLSHLVHDMARSIKKLKTDDYSEENGMLDSRKQGLPNQAKQLQLEDILRSFVYAAAETGAMELIEVLFSFSVGKIVFKTYQNESPLPENIAEDNGHNDLAAYLRSITKRYSEEDSTSPAQSKVIDWLELANALEKINLVHSESSSDKGVMWKDDILETGYSADGETSSSGSEKEVSDSEDDYKRISISTGLQLPEHVSENVPVSFGVSVNEEDETGYGSEAFSSGRNADEPSSESGQLPIKNVQDIIQGNCNQGPYMMEYSQEQLNYFRLCHVVFNLVPIGLRQIFKNEWDFLYKTGRIGEWKDTAENGLNFYNNESRKSQRRNARCLATVKNGNTTEWDCTCLYSDSIGTTLGPAVNKDVEDIRYVRNDIAHNSDTKLTDADFQSYVGRVINAFTSLGLPANDIEDIKNQTSFPTEEIENLRKQVLDFQTTSQSTEANLFFAKEENKTLTQEISKKISLTPPHKVIRRFPSWSSWSEYLKAFAPKQREVTKKRFASESLGYPKKATIASKVVGSADFFFSTQEIEPDQGADTRWTDTSSDFQKSDCPEVTIATAPQDVRGQHAYCQTRTTFKATFLGSEWNSSAGGLSTLKLAIHLSKHPKVEVSLLVPEGACKDGEKRAAQSCGVTIVDAKKRPAFDPLDWLSFPPQILSMDIVVDHGVKLGRQGQIIKDSSRFHNCKWVQVVHTAPEDLSKFKRYADPISKGERKHQDEVDLCKLADLVVPVGPRLEEFYSSYLRRCKKNKDVLSITPGLFDREFGDLEQAPNENADFKVLMFDRGDDKDFELKVYNFAAKAFTDQRLKRKPIHLIFVGAPDRKQEEVRQKLVQCGIAEEQLIARTFIQGRERIKDLLCEADRAIMPSKSEGFGLVAPEALSAGLPILVGSKSGFAKALENVPIGHSCIVDSDDPTKWAEAIMPSKSEGFGLVALEALSAGLPILVGSKSGFAKALENVPIGHSCIVDSDDPTKWAKAIMPGGFSVVVLEAMSGGSPILVGSKSGFAKALENVPIGHSCIVDSDDPTKWAEAIEAVRTRHRMRLKEIKALRASYETTYCWKEQCEALVEKMWFLVNGPSNGSLKTAEEGPHPRKRAFKTTEDGRSLTSTVIKHSYQDLNDEQQEIVREILMRQIQVYTRHHNFATRDGVGGLIKHIIETHHLALKSVGVSFW